MKIQNIEMVARPTAILWCPKINETDGESTFIIANDEYKLKEFNSDSKLCRKTTLAPIFSDITNFNSNLNQNSNANMNNNFNLNYSTSTTASSSSISSPPNALIPIKINGIKGHYAYSCTSRIIGLGSFPLTGDPSEVHKFSNE